VSEHISFERAKKLCIEICNKVGNKLKNKKIDSESTEDE
jgi:hypothetical protein